MENIVYLLWDPRNGDIRYMGKTSNRRRLERHQRTTMAGRTHCSRWLAELAREGLRCEWAVVEEGLAPEEANAQERWWITYARRCGWPITNHTDGGDGTSGMIFSSEHRKKLSNARCGRLCSSATRQKMSDAHRKKHHSSGARQKIGDARRGKHHSPEARQKIGDAFRGKHLSSEHREKISVAVRRYWHKQPEEE